LPTSLANMGGAGPVKGPNESLMSKILEAKKTDKTAAQSSASKRYKKHDESTRKEESKQPMVYEDKSDLEMEFPIERPDSPQTA